MTEANSGLGFALLALTFGGLSPVFGALCEVLDRRVVAGLGIAILSISIFFVGPSQLFLPDDLYLMFIGLAFAGAGFAAIWATVIPEIVSCIHIDINFKRVAQGLSPHEKPSTEVSDKGSALQNMAFAFGNFAAPIIGGAI